MELPELCCVLVVCCYFHVSTPHLHIVVVTRELEKDVVAVIPKLAGIELKTG
jgi:hypothetical protein